MAHTVDSATSDEREIVALTTRGGDRITIDVNESATPPYLAVSCNGDDPIQCDMDEVEILALAVLRKTRGN